MKYGEYDSLGVGAEGVGTLGVGTLGVGTLGVGTLGVGTLGVGALGVGAVGVGVQFGILGDAGYPLVEHAVAEEPQTEPVSFVEDSYCPPASSV